jgi:hypothetical protein
VKASFGSCQEEHEMRPSSDGRASKKSLRPRSVFAGIIGLFFGTKYQASSGSPREVEGFHEDCCALKCAVSQRQSVAPAKKIRKRMILRR